MGVADLSVCMAAVLHNFAVFPAHKEGGAGALLLSWPFERADEEGVYTHVALVREPMIEGGKERK